MVDSRDNVATHLTLQVSQGTSSWARDSAAADVADDACSTARPLPAPTWTTQRCMLIIDGVLNVLRMIHRVGCRVKVRLMIRPMVGRCLDRDCSRDSRVYGLRVVHLDVQDVLLLLRYLFLMSLELGLARINRRASLVAKSRWRRGRKILVGRRGTDRQGSSRMRRGIRTGLVLPVEQFGFSLIDVASSIVVRLPHG